MIAVRWRKVLLFAAAPVAAIVLGVVSTVAVLGWPQAHPYAATPWSVDDSGPGMGPMRWSMGGVSVDGEFDYLTHMVAHHQEAVDSARQLERSGRAEMRALGSSIVTTQSAEITRMNAWLAQWYPGRSTAVDYRPMMGDLSGLTGDPLDEAFLRDMIPHHMAAVMMSQRLLVQGRIPHQEVAGFASTVRDTQHSEILQMRRYLAGWFGGRAQMPFGTGPAGSPAPCIGDSGWGPGGMIGGGPGGMRGW